MMLQKGFTLIELLVVIGILAVLSVVIILTLNPAELLKQARDSTRVSDLATVKKAISLYQVSAGGTLQLGNYDKCYVSVPRFPSGVPAGMDSNWCAMSGPAPGTPGVQRFVTFPGVPATTGVPNPNLTDGSGWVPVPISTVSAGSGGPPISNLPLDPINSTAVVSGVINTASAIGAYYAYRAGNNEPVQANAQCVGSCTVYEINAFLESAKFAPRMVSDGGSSDNLYEVGTDPGLDL